MIKKIIYLAVWCIPLIGNNSHVSGDWTWIYHKNFVEHRAGTIPTKPLWFSHDNVPPFTQLVFSWNVVRPEQGYFSFYVQVRDAATKKWGKWHHMVDWGKDIQQSYLKKSDGFSSYVHVRLETDDKKLADAFRVKIESQKLAPLFLVKAVAVVVSDFNSFKAESHKNMDALQSVHVSHMPAVAQLALDHEDNGRICSPVSCSMIVHYITGTYQDPLAFAAAAFDTGLGVYGSWGCNMAHAFEQAEGKAYFFVRRMNSFTDLHDQLMQGLPVAVSVRGDLPGALKSFPHGHLMVVVGWDHDSHEVLCHDPAAEHQDAVLKRYPLEHFLRAWECSHRLAYIVEPIKKL